MKINLGFRRGPEYELGYPIRKTKAQIKASFRNFVHCLGALQAISTHFFFLKNFIVCSLLSESWLNNHELPHNKFKKKKEKKKQTILMEFYLEEGKQLNPKCSTLILPALSIGNVGQLAVDLLISTLKADKIGCLDDPNVLPCVGNDAYYPSPLGKLALSLEAYESSSNALTLVQQRSPVIKGMTIEYAKNMANFAAANGKKHVVILSSLDFGRWRNINMSSGLQVYYLSSSNVDGTDAECESLGWNRLQDYDPSQRTWEHLNALAKEGSVPDEDFPTEELGDEDYYPSLPFAALFSCFKAKGLKVTCVLCYCSEGDNIPEAFSMAEAASRLIGLNDNEFQGNGADKWITPFSWQSVYGPPADTSLF